VPRERLRLFRDVILEIDLRQASADKLIAALEKEIRHLSVSERERKEGLLFVTFDTPATPHFGSETADFGKKPLSRESYRYKTAPAVRATDLPSYDALRRPGRESPGQSPRHALELLGCRVLGCVTAADAKRTITTRQPPNDSLTRRPLATADGNASVAVLVAPRAARPRRA
jgi:hypothetical protein